MELVENKKMFYMVQNTPLNQKYHNHEIGDKFKTSKKILLKVPQMLSSKIHQQKQVK